MTLLRDTLEGLASPLTESDRWARLSVWQQRAVKTLVAVTVLILVSSVLYHWVLVVFEDRSPAFAHSVQVVVEIYTGTGFGSDAPWESTVANALVSVMDLSTFLLLFIIFPYVFGPVVEQALSPTVPTAVEMADHVVICGIEQQGNRLVEEFEARDVEYVVIAETEKAGLELAAADVPVIHGDPTAAETHRNACVGDARTVVVDTQEDRSVSVLLAIRELDEYVRTIVLVETLARRRHLASVGADRVLTPRHLLGRRLAERITTEITPTRSDSTPLGETLSILELTVFADSPICGETLDEVETSGEVSVTVLGLWQEGRFEDSPASETVVDADTVLLVAGSESALRALEAKTYRGRNVEPTVVIAGNGIVGSTVRRTLEASAAACTVVDISPGEDVDIVGDVTREETLLEANITDATVYVVAVSDDDDAILSVVLAEELASDLDIIVRLNRESDETKVRRAGADYVLSLPAMTGRVLAREVLHEEILTYGRQLKPVRLDAEPFAGQSLAETEIAERDCIVLAVERGGDLLTDVSPEFELRSGDTILLIGRDSDIDALPS